ncbi:hypothetical protein FNF27_08279 [Cafeteria roenbergensis]|uniref:Pectate lyase superfamily protein domain-containing protein n=2 Tax=Cafeteria roenbergensis TaxID=33653 RepID=A0A5A8D7S6_CAFRO|nr:hypothetical protein FNF31_05327 [Cafeteria roenbergensis]KAA0160021.1 hypothetical protein FNF27_08279 [Cafeteria roenbergensis]KAA0171088.1 hypothetical protein FNF28_01093 [Cafeteria roenbergensis]
MPSVRHQSAPRVAGAALVAAGVLVAATATASRVCSVQDFGAKPNTGTAQTAAIQAAIDACSGDTAGEVVLPLLPEGGNWTSGSLFLNSNLVFRIAPGAALLGSTSMDNETYPTVYTRVAGTMGFAPASLLNGARCQDLSGYDPAKVGDQCKRWNKLSNVVITGAASSQDPSERPALGASPGAGIIDGQGEGWWQHLDFRPTLLGLLWIDGLTLSDLYLTRSPFWTVHPLFSSNVLADGLTVRTSGPNTDGFDPDSCANVTLQRSDLSCGDDVVAIKSGKNEDGRAVGIPTTNVTVRDCAFGLGHGLSIGSETSGNVTDVRIQRVTMTGTQRGVRVKSGKGRGGVVANILYEDMQLQGVGTPVSISQLYTKPTSPGPAPEFRSITVRNLTSVDSPAGSGAGEVSCLPESPCDSGFSFLHMHVSTSGKWTCSNADVSSTDVSPVMPAACRSV